jgi:hypothetical protein
MCAGPARTTTDDETGPLRPRIQASTSGSSGT